MRDCGVLCLSLYANSQPNLANKKSNRLNTVHAEKKSQRCDDKELVEELPKRVEQRRILADEIKAFSEEKENN